MRNFNRTFLVIGVDFVSSSFANWLVAKYSGDRVIFATQIRADDRELHDAIALEMLDSNHEISMIDLFEKYKFDIVINFVVSRNIVDFCFDNGICLVQVLNQFDECDYQCDKTITHSICYGARQDSTDFMPTAITRAMNEEFISVPYDEIKNDMLHVTDCCDAIDKVMNFGHGQYDACTGFRISEKDIARLILKEFELPLSFVEYIDDESESTNRQLNNNSLTVLGWSPVVDFEQGLKQMIKWYTMRG